MVELREMRPAVGFVALTLGLGLAACSSNNESSGSTNGAATAGGAGELGCTSDPRVETLAVDLTHKGDSGKLSFVITKAQFIPPAPETNTWTVKILDANGAAVKDAMLTFPRRNHPADPWMPDHGHGGTPASAVNNGDGTYKISPLYFFMAGVWSTYISATTGSATDTTTFTFCVGG